MESIGNDAWMWFKPSITPFSYPSFKFKGSQRRTLPKEGQSSQEKRVSTEAPLRSGTIRSASPSFSDPCMADSPITRNPASLADLFRSGNPRRPRTHWLKAQVLNRLEIGCRMRLWVGDALRGHDRLKNPFQSSSLQNLRAALTPERREPVAKPTGMARATVVTKSTAPGIGSACSDTNWA